MKHRTKLNLLTIALLACFSTSMFSSFAEEKKEKPEKEEKSKYEKFIADDVESKSGLFTIYKIDDEYYFELNDSLLGRDMLLGARVSELSSTSKVVAGEMRKSPIQIRFSRDNKNIYMHQMVSDYISDPDDEISVSVQRNSITPILETFPIEALNCDSTAAVFEVTKYFSAEIPAVSPFNSKYKAGKLESDATFIIKTQAFPQNVEIKTQMSYSGSRPFLVVMNRSILLLPEQPMRPRLEDKRIGYFANSERYFSSDFIGVKTLKYISRFNIQPKAEDLEKYKAGELVEPAKPIVFYIDNAFPKEWRPYLKAGVEDWQIAFEAIGFKNAIIAKDYPEDDEDFNPEDMRYSCIRYISTPKANSMGPRWIDPRSGEVISGDVLWWHNVAELLRDWRFVQCAAAEPEARKKNPDIETLGEMVRYVAAHELGHVLGLKHNMRASYSFPVDSLRSASFTQKNGTTPSIMDYARFNYIAQPGDEGIKFTPPHMGPYDKFAIKWGYMPIFQTDCPIEEQKILNEWILEKKDNIIYRYGDQQMGIAFDPSSQNEALGDDAVKASTYGVANAKYIMEHLVEWTTKENEDYDHLTHMYSELIKQYKRYIGHVASYLGGVYIYKSVEGENKEFYSPVAKQKQKEALSWLFNELNTQHEWMLNQDIISRIGTRKNDLFKSQAETLDIIMSGVVLQRLELYHNEFNCKEYLDDVYSHVWKKTINGEVLNEFDKHLQASYVHNLKTMLAVKAVVTKPKVSDEDPQGLGSANSSKTLFLDNLIKPLLQEKLEETRMLLKKKIKVKNELDQAHYKYYYDLIN